MELLNEDHTHASEIAALIKRNHAIAARILRAVNSAYYGLFEQVDDLEEAILYVGLTQVRRIVLFSAVLEDPQDFGSVSAKEVRGTWRHSLATAILTQELIKFGALRINEETSYLAGLLHNVGHLVMRAVSPDRLRILNSVRHASISELLAAEKRLFTWNHARIGAYYLKRLPLAVSVAEAVEQHHTPEKSKTNAPLAAAISLAEELARRGGLDGFPKVQNLSNATWNQLPAWKTIFGNETKRAHVTAMRLEHFLPSLPDLLHGFS